MSSLRNDQITLVALWLLGGNSDRVDTEDVALRVDELAPGRFRWRKYPSHIDLGLVRNGLQDGRKKELVDGGALKGWLLTAAGSAEAERLLPLITGTEVVTRLPAEQRAWLTRERARLIQEPAFLTSCTEGIQAASDRDVLRFFKLDEYVTDERRNERIRRFTTAFENDPEIGSVVKQLSERILYGK